MTVIGEFPATQGASADVASRRRLLAQDWQKLLRSGAILALGQVFIALSGMPVNFDRRLLIDPILSLGYLSLAWLPLVVSYWVGREQVLEGMAGYARGGRDVLAGAIAGALGNCGLTLLVVGITHFDIRDPLVNWSPQLLAILQFEESVWLGTVIWPLIGAATGALGGGMHWASTRITRTAVIAGLTVFGAAVLESVITDLSQGFHIDAAADWLYGSKRGLTYPGAIVVAVAAIVVVSGISAYRASLMRAGLVGRQQSQAAPGESNRSQAVWRQFISRRHEHLRRSRQPRTGQAVWRQFISRRLLGYALVIAAVVVLPLFLGRITNELLANVGLFILLALGLNIIVGLAGILDLGYVAFFAVGGYSVAVLTSPGSPRFSLEMPWFGALFIAMLLAGLVGLFIGAPVIRMRGDYLAVVTLGFGEIIRILLLSDWLSGTFNGAQGITNIPGVEVFGLATVRGFEPRSVLYLVLFFCAIAIYVSWRLENSRIGRAWIAVREDETVAEVMGVDTVSAKLMAFVTGAVLGSFSGAILSAKVGSVFPHSFAIIVSIVILVVVIFGGMGNIPGVIAGAVVLIGVLGGPNQPGLLQEFAEYKTLIYGTLLVWMMLQRSEGLIPSVRSARALHIDDTNQDAWLRAQPDGDDATSGGGGNSSEGEQP